MEPRLSPLQAPSSQFAQHSRPPSVDSGLPGRVRVGGEILANRNAKAARTHSHPSPLPQGERELNDPARIGEGHNFYPNRWQVTAEDPRGGPSPGCTPSAQKTAHKTSGTAWVRGLSVAAQRLTQGRSGAHSAPGEGKRVVDDEEYDAKTPVRRRLLILSGSVGLSRQWAWRVLNHLGSAGATPTTGRSWIPGCAETEGLRRGSQWRAWLPAPNRPRRPVSLPGPGGGWARRFPM